MPVGSHFADQNVHQIFQFLVPGTLVPGAEETYFKAIVQQTRHQGHLSSRTVTQKCLGTANGQMLQSSPVPLRLVPRHLVASVVGGIQALIFNTSIAQYYARATPKAQDSPDPFTTFSLTDLKLPFL